MTTTVTSTMSANSTGSHRNHTSDELEALNNQKAITLLPAMILLGILMIVGIVGNSLACYVFCCRLKSGTQNFLIVCLAVFDLISCSVSIPFEIADMRYYYDFRSIGACKIMRFLNTFCAIGSILTLVVIAVDRYRKICKPLHGQLRMYHVRLSLIPILGVTIFFSWPAFVMYGLRTTETGIDGLYGTDCSTPDGMNDTKYPLLYNVILFLCFIILAVTLIIIYTLVLRETKRHNRYLKRNSDFNLPSSGYYNSEESHSSNEPASPNNASSGSDHVINTTARARYGSNSTIQTTMEAPTTDTQLNPVTKSTDTKQENNFAYNSPETATQEQSEATRSETTQKTATGSQAPQETATHTQTPQETATHSQTPPETATHSQTTQETATRSQTPHGTAKRSSLSSSNGEKKHGFRKIIFIDSVFTSPKKSLKKHLKIKSKTTLIAFLVTLVFIVSFLPHLILQVTKLVLKGFDYNLKDSGLVAYNIFVRSYFFNSVSNPMIYGALNVQFNNEVKLLIQKCCRKSIK